MSFRFVPKSVTLNDLERRIKAVIVHCFSRFWGTVLSATEM